MELPFRQLQLALQGLAQPAAGQVSLFPEFVSPAVELFDDLRISADTVLTIGGIDVSVEQRWAIQSLLEHFDGFDDGDAVWTHEALFQDPRWETARSLAKEALATFNWPADPPSESISSYVR